MNPMFGNYWEHQQKPLTERLKIRKEKLVNQEPPVIKINLPYPIKQSKVQLSDLYQENSPTFDIDYKHIGIIKIEFIILPSQQFLRIKRYQEHKKLNEYMSQKQNQVNFNKQQNQQSQAHGINNQSSSTTEFHVNKLLNRDEQSINSHNQSSLSRLVQVSTLQEDNSFIFLNRSPGSELRKEHELSNIPSNSQTDQVLGKDISIKQNQQSHNQSSNQQSKNETHINIKDQSLISFGKYDSNFQIQNINNSNNLQGDIPSSQDQTQHLDYTIQPSPKQVLHVDLIILIYSDRHSNRQSRSVSQQNLISDSNLLNCSNQSFYDSDKIIQQEIDEVVNFNEIDDSFQRYLQRNKSESRQTQVNNDEFYQLNDSQKSLNQKVQENYDQKFSKPNHLKIVSKDLEFPSQNSSLQSQKQKSKHNFQHYLIEHILKDEDMSSFTDKLYQQTPQSQTSKRQLENQISYKTIKEEDLEDDDIQEQRQLHVVPQQVQFFSQAQKNLRSDFAIGSRTVVFHKPNTSEQSSEQKNLNSQKFNDFNSEVQEQKRNTAFQNPLMQYLAYKLFQIVKVRGKSKEIKYRKIIKKSQFFLQLRTIIQSLASQEFQQAQLKSQLPLIYQLNQRVVLIILRNRLIQQRQISYNILLIKVTQNNNLKIFWN